MRKINRILLWVTFIIYCCALAIILFFTSRGSYWRHKIPLWDYIKYFSNFIPFRTIIGYIKAISRGTMNLDIPIKNIFGNLLLFLPMGLYLPCLSKGLRTFGRLIVSMMLIIVLIEMLQVLLRRGSIDVDDFILNISGVIIGFAIWRVTIIQKVLNKMHLIKN